eukprot:scaffold241573_cov18-Prasinocladus_malaysianus.AAC.1
MMMRSRHTVEKLNHPAYLNAKENFATYIVHKMLLKRHGRGTTNDSIPMDWLHKSNTVPEPRHPDFPTSFNVALARLKTPRCKTAARHMCAKGCWAWVGDPGDAEDRKDQQHEV